MLAGSALGPQSSGTWGTHVWRVTSVARGRRGAAAAAHPVSQGRPREAPAPVPSRPPPGLAPGSLTQHPEPPHSPEELCNDHREAHGVKGETQTRKASRRLAELLPQPEETGAGTVSNQAGVDQFLLSHWKKPSFHHSHGPPEHLPVEPAARTNLRLAGTAMENLDVPIPDLTEKQQDVFQRVFAADAKYLENHEKTNQSFWESLVKCLATTDPPILNTEEKNNLLNSCDVLPGGCAACLEAVEKKGVRAMALLYLLLKTSNPSGYKQLPSSKGKDEKLKLLKRLERNFLYSEEGKKSENSSHESMDEDTQDSDEEDLGRQKTEGQLLGGIPAEVVPYRDSEIARREDADAYEKESTHPPQWTVRWMGIRKDDEFFHFVILCFAIGALLVCYYYHKDWTISLGVGLITFASLETTGIYFGLVYRIRSVLDSFVPLIDRFRPRGLRKAA